MTTRAAIAAVATAVALAVAGCGVTGTDSTATADTTTTSTIAADTTTTSTTTTAATTTTTEAPQAVDLSEVSITVGSKDFTENQIVAEMFAQAVEAAGGSVDRQIDLGGTNVNRDALTAGQIDAYPEYNGTGWTVHLGNDDPSDDPDELFEVTSEADLEQNEIRWIGRSAFNNTYGFATGPDLTEENGGAFTPQEMADYLDENSDAVACMEPEFPVRPDGLVLFEEATDFTIPPNQQEVMDSGIIFQQIASCPFGEVFTTDGRIPELDLTVVDDGGAFIVYNVSLTLSDSLYQRAPDAFDEIAEGILADLDDDTMAELNRLVDVEGESLEDVASDYLSEQGLI
jgi:osmoprotectant transport system substrate-binding protein